MPANVRELEDAVGVRLVVSDKTDPDDAGFVQWRVGFYVAGDLNNFLMLLDDWFVYKAKATKRDQPFQVHLYPHIGVEVTNVEDFAYDHIELNEPSPVLPLGIFQCQPCIGKSIVTLNLQIEADTMNIVITGNTWSFRSRMNTFGVWGGYQEASTIDQKRPYLRVLKDLDLSDDAQKERVLSMIGESVFHNLAMRVRIDPGDKPLEPDCWRYEVLAVTKGTGPAGTPQRCVYTFNWIHTRLPSWQSCTNCLACILRKEPRRKSEGH